MPPGSYKLRLWHPGLPPNTEPAPVTITVGSADIDHNAQIAVTAEP